MQKHILQRLLIHFFSDTISREECADLLTQISIEDPDHLESVITEQHLELKDGPVFHLFTEEKILSRIKADPRYQASLQENKKPVFNTYRFLPKQLISIAAVFTLLAVAGLLIRMQTYQPEKQKILSPEKSQHSITRNRILPGTNKAILKLASGAVILLDTAKSGILAREGNVPIFKTGTGRLVYQHTSSGIQSASAAAYNIISTPRGGQYQLVLPDGTQVWLNAASSLRYPTLFSGAHRDVTLTGEAYFEVVKDKAHSFRVLINKQEVEVLGTHFNINGYTDECSVKTTLTEGSVKVSTQRKTVWLQPGEQADVPDGNPELASVSKVDVSNVMAWKNGNFQFENAEVSFIMRQVARWYDVDIVYSGIPSKKRFTGTISRIVPLADLLTMLGYTGLDFKISGFKIIVSN